MSKPIDFILDQAAVEAAQAKLRDAGVATPRKRKRKTKPSEPSAKAIAKARREAQGPPPSVPGFERVLPFADWCRLKNFSANTGKRLIREGKVKITRLSQKRIGVSESADRQFMQACESAS
jgi:hypothetical protein